MAVSKSKSRPTFPVEYPDGVLVESERGVYYIKGGKRYKLYSPRVVQSWSLKPIVGSEVSLANYKRAAQPLGFRDSTLIHNIADGRLYIISGNKRRQVVSPDVLKQFGWSWDDAIIVSDEEAKLHEQGEVIG